MKTNDLKKGDRVLLRMGGTWPRSFDARYAADKPLTEAILGPNARYATIADNRKGNTRLANVEGFYEETGSIYAHDIMLYIPDDGAVIVIEHTPAQLKLKATLEGLGL